MPRTGAGGSAKPGRMAARLRAVLVAGTVLAEAAALPLAAGEAQDRVFALGVLGPVATGDQLLYRHRRSGALDPNVLPAIADGEFVVELAAGAEGRREALVTRRAGGAVQSRTAMPAGGGHPLLLVFLDATVRDLAAMTGGSPFYIRNRIREALARQDAVEPVEIALGDRRVDGERLSFRPFLEDPNRARMGALAALEISFDLSDAVPGGFARFAAVAGPGADGTPALVESIEFDQVEGN